MAQFTAHISDDGTEQTVEEHCQNVSEYAAGEAETTHLSCLLKIAGLLHDMGKNTYVFNEYIHKAHANPKSVHRGEINHSSAGGKYIYEKFGSGGNFERLTAQLISYAIVSHHGVSDCLTGAGDDCFSARIFPKKDICFEEAISNSRIYLNEAETDRLFQNAVSEVKGFYNSIMKVTSEMGQNQESSSQFMFGCMQRLILSLLIDADRRDTAEFMSGQKEIRMTVPETKKIWSDYTNKLEERLNEFQVHSHIDELRAEMSDLCWKFAENGDGIYRLSIPTGGGKTLAGMRYALKMAYRTGKKHIYYIAPFLSILEQNASVLRDIFRDDKHILEHHSNVIIDADNTEELDRHELYADDWSAPLILTTMVQFLNVLFDASTQSVRRMHQMTDSVIIIDEAQSVPVKCINLFTTMMNFLSRCCNTTVILCTATQPLFEETKRKILYGKPADMIGNARKYAEEFKRVNISSAVTDKGFDTIQLADFVMQKFDQNMLIILNTKSAVQKLYEEIKKRTGGADIRVIQLTTYMCAQHRLDLINEMRSTLGKTRMICISTQLIEAGVDVSFQTVIRSLAGLDSIMQAAGRCNRNAENASGNVYIIRYSEENISELKDIRAGQSAAQIILDKYHEDLLMPEAMNIYYRQYFFDRAAEMDYFIDKSDDRTIYKLLSDNQSGEHAYADIEDKRYPYILKQAYKEAGTAFEVIDDHNRVDLIVPYKDAKELIDKIKKSYSIPEMKECLKKLQRFTVNLFRTDPKLKMLMERRAVDQTVMDGEVWILDKDYYTCEVGVSTDLKFLEM